MRDDSLPVPGAWLLGIETSGPLCRMALLGPGFEAERAGERPFAHAEEMPGLLEGLFREAEISLGELWGVVLSLGPGFFTSLRVGAAYAKALWLAHPKLKLFGVKTTLAIAKETGLPRVGVALDAKKGEVYGAVYENCKETVPLAIYPPQELARLARGAPFAGDGPAKHPALGPRVGPERPRALTLLGMLEFAQELDPLNFVPLYIRLPDAVAKKRKS